VKAAAAAGDAAPAASAARPRIVRLIPVLDYGGVETTFITQARHIDRSSFDFRVATFWKAGAAARKISESGIPVADLGIDPSIRNRAATRRLAAYLKEVQPDIVHASIGEANIHAALVSKRSGVPVTIIEEQGIPSRGLVGRLGHAFLYRRVDAIVGVSEASCRYLIEREHAPRSKVHLLYNAVRDDFLRPLAQRTHDGSFTILTIGRLHPVKNHQRLIRAFAPVAAAVPRARLRIVGSGDEEAGLRRTIAELGLQERVDLPGFSADVIGLLDSADCFVLPSLSEGFGIAIVEAMARGLPVIASDSGALPEIVGGLGREWIVSPLDVDGWSAAMIRLAQLAPPERERLGRAARGVAERFSERRHIDGLQDLYRKLLAGKAGPGSRSRE
jgi:glycosyltransferase involved in cell wall biosynthesis